MSPLNHVWCVIETRYVTFAASRVIDGQGERQVILDRVEDQMGHQLDHFPWSEVLPGFLVIFLVELADQLFKHIAHPQIGQTGQLVAVRVHHVIGREVDFG